jgi:hypothetical protein
MLRLHRRLSLARAAVPMTATLAPMAAEAAPSTIASTPTPPWTYGFYMGTLSGTSAGARRGTPGHTHGPGRHRQDAPRVGSGRCGHA